MINNLRCVQAMILVLLLFCIGNYAMAENSATLNLPTALEIIEEEAFYSGTSIEKVIIPEGVREIRGKAFADSSLTEIHLPESLAFIADDAFDGCAGINITAVNGSYAYQWAVANGYIDQEALIESSHPYMPNTDQVWEYVHSENAYALAITFSDDTRFEHNEDYLHIIDKDENKTSYTGSNLAGRTVAVKGNAFTLNMTSNSSNQYYGFQIVSIDKITTEEDYKAFLGDGFDYYIIGRTIAITGYTGNRNDVVVPNTIEGYPVTEIWEYAFDNCSNLTNIDLPESLTTIGKSAFYNCSSLTNINLPKALTTIEYNTFGYCYSLTDIDIPDGVMSIGSDAFQGCDSLTSIEIPEGVTSIGDYAFYSCDGLKKVVIPSSVDSIGEHVFSYSFNVGVVAPEGSYAYEWSAARNLLFETSVLESTHPFPNYTTETWNYTHPGNPYALKLTFSNRTDLSSDLLTIKAEDGTELVYTGEDLSGETIGVRGGGFELTLTSNRTNGGDTRFGFRIVKAETLTKEEYEARYIYTTRELDNGTLEIKKYAGNASEVSIPAEIDGKRVTAIGRNAFFHCDSLKYIDIPASVKSIGEYAFSGCSNLGDIDLPNAVTIIGHNAFRGCTGLTYIDIPDGVTTIADATFYGCSGLKEIELPEALTSIGKYSFTFCTGLEKIDFPDTLISIDEAAFGSCIALRKIEFPDSLTTLGSGAFLWTDVKEFIVPGNMTSIASWAFGNYTTKAEIITEPGSATSRILAESGIAHTYIGVDSAVISGDIKTFDGLALSEVTVFCGNDTFVTDEDGKWLFTCTPGLEYTVSFEKEGCTFVPASVTITARADSNSVPSVLAVGEGEALPEIAPPVITAPADGGKVSPLDAVLRWRDETYANGYRVSLYVINKGMESAVFADAETRELYYPLELQSGTSYRAEVTAWNGAQSVSSSVGFRTAAPEDTAAVTSFTMSALEVRTGKEVEFVVTAPGAAYVQMLVDAKAYDQCFVNADGIARFYREFTQSGEKSISFRTFDGEVHGIPCEAKTLKVTSFGVLSKPCVTVSDSTVYQGDGLTVQWECVEHADGYVVYVYSVDREIARVVCGIEELSMDIPAKWIDEAGKYTVLVMPFGLDYDQSEGTAEFIVTDEYCTWTGWPQKNTIPFYTNSSTVTASGTFAYTQALEVLGEIGARYRVKAIDTGKSGYVRMSDVGTEEYSNTTTMKAYYKTENGGKTLTLVTSTDVVCAGIERGEFVQEKSKPDLINTSSMIFRFFDTPEVGTAIYDVWARSADGTTISSSLTVLVDPDVEATPSPDATVKPGVTPVPGTTAPAVTIPLPTITPMITTPPPTTAPETKACAVYEQYGRHDVSCSGKLRMIADVKGKQKFIDGYCYNSETTVQIGVFPSTQLKWNAPIIGSNYYSTSALSWSNDGTRYAQITINDDFIVDSNTNWSNADIIVNGDVTINATLECRSLMCSRLTVEKNAFLILSDGGAVIINTEDKNGKMSVQGVIGQAGRIECYDLVIGDSGRVVLTDRAEVVVQRDVTINNELSGGINLICDKLTVGRLGKLYMSKGFKANIDSEFDFRSEMSHEGMFTKDSVIIIGHDANVDISSDEFQFGGTFKLLDNTIKFKIKKSGENGSYISTIELTESAIIVSTDGTLVLNVDKIVEMAGNEVKKYVADNVRDKVDELMEFLEIPKLDTGRYFWAELPKAINGRKPQTDSNGKVNEAYYRNLVDERMQTGSLEEAASLILSSNYMISYNQMYDSEAREVYKKAGAYGIASLLLNQTDMTLKHALGLTRNTTMVFSSFPRSYSFEYGNARFKLQNISGFVAETFSVTSQSFSAGNPFITGTLYVYDRNGNAFECGNVTYAPRGEQLMNACNEIINAGKAESEKLVEEAKEDIIDEAKALLGIYDEIEYITGSDVERFYNRITISNESSYRPTEVTQSAAFQYSDIDMINKLRSFYNKWKAFEAKLDQDIYAD